jgi:hypothetical protein
VNGVVEDTRDVQYHVNFHAGGADLQLHIFLPPGFPKDPPEVKVSPPCGHAWIAGDGSVTGCPELQKYSLHESMGKVIKHIIDELKANPPVVLRGPQLSSSSPPYPTMPVFFQSSSEGYVNFQPTGPPPVTVHHNNLPMGGFLPRRAPPPVPGQRKYHAAPVPSEFPELKNKTEDELKEYLDDIEGAILINQMLERHPVMEKLRKDREELLVKIEKQAGVNITREPELLQGWDTLQSHHLELNEWKSTFSQFTTKQMKLSKKLSLASMTSRLGQLSLKSETDSDALGEEFLDGKVDTNKFIKSFMEERKLHYLRQAKSKMLNSPDQTYK